MNLNPFAWWRRVQREMDIRVLWTEIQSVADTRAEAQLMFRRLMEDSPAYRDLTESEKHHFVENLP